MQTRQDHIDQLKNLMANLAREVDTHNDLVRKFNDEVFTAREDVERAVEDVNEVVQQLNDLGAQVCTDLRDRAEAEGINPDSDSAIKDMIASWAEFASLPELELPRKFSVAAARRMILRVPSQSRRTLLQERFERAMETVAQ